MHASSTHSYWLDEPVPCRHGNIREVNYHAVHRYRHRHGGTNSDALEAILRIARNGCRNKGAKAGLAIREGTEVIGVNDSDRGYLVVVTYYHLRGHAKTRFLKDLIGQGRKPGRDRAWANHKRKGKHARYLPPPTDSLPTPEELEAEMQGESLHLEP